MQKLTLQARQAIVEDFLRSGVGQEAYCEQLARERGLQVAPRTLVRGSRISARLRTPET